MYFLHVLIVIELKSWNIFEAPKL
uniref:Uncharacterized protein n=1 Tax=Arundo donax TaxID=35708 RepID=A0A0A9TXF7_ARUDO